MATFTCENRGASSDALSIQDMQPSPAAPKPGKDSLTVAITGRADEQVQWEGAYAQVTVKLGLIKILQKEFMLADMLGPDSEYKVRVESGGDDKGIGPGAVRLTLVTPTLPREIPQAKFVVVVHAYTADESDLFSFIWTLSFLPS